MFKQTKKGQRRTPEASNIEDLTIPKPEGTGEGIVIGIWSG